MRFLDILVVFRLDLGQISFNLAENGFATRQLAFLAIGIVFYVISTRACTEIKIFEIVCGRQSDLRLEAFRLLEFFFAFPFSPFLFFLLQRLTFYWACLRLKSF